MIYSGLLILKVIQMGFEPMTHALEGRCSIQLSYQTNHLFFIYNSQFFSGMSWIIV